MNEQSKAVCVRALTCSAYQVSLTILAESNAAGLMTATQRYILFIRYSAEQGQIACVTSTDDMTRGC